jgi:hypothetical protein
MWERVLRVSQRTPKRLRLCESLTLGLKENGFGK